MALHLKSTGIDFADFATDGGGVTTQAELFDDYEQGTWTAGMNIGWEGAGGGNQVYRSTFIKTGNHIWQHFAADWGQTQDDMRVTGGAYAADYTVPITISSQAGYTKNAFGRYGGSQYDWNYSGHSGTAYFDSVYNHILEDNLH